MANRSEYTGYKWRGLLKFPEGTYYHQIGQTFFKSIDWVAVCRYASEIRDGEICTLDPQITMGCNHMIRILNFADGSRWIARLRMISTKIGVEADSQCRYFQREIDCIQLVKERLRIPVPALFGYIASPDNHIGAPVMFQECLPGNCGMDMNAGMEIPTQHKSSFFAAMSDFQVSSHSYLLIDLALRDRQTEISTIMLPKIGSVIRLSDGTYDVGPLPSIGGPFNTVTEYLEAWANTVQFPYMDTLRASCGDKSDKIEASILRFPLRIKELAATIPIRNHGPFPLMHNDFGHNNIVVDDNWKVLGVIDWEHAWSAPWEVNDFPLALRLMPKLIDAAWCYNENGEPVQESAKIRIQDRKDYVDCIRQAEKKKGLPPLLSAVLTDKAGNDLTEAMSLYSEGIFAEYCNIIDAYHERWRGQAGGPDTHDVANTSKAAG